LFYYFLTFENRPPLIRLMNIKSREKISKFMDLQQFNDYIIMMEDYKNPLETYFKYITVK
jgi:hypothetical protein